MNNCEQGHARKKKTFTKSTYVPDPAENIVYIPFNDVEFEVDLKSDLDVDWVIFFVRTRLFLNKFEDPVSLAWPDLCEVKAVILQVQVGDCELKNFFLSQLAINRNPVSSRFAHKLFIWVFLVNKSFLIVIRQDGFLFQPMYDFSFILALDSDEVRSTRVALFKLNDEGARLRWVIVTLDAKEIWVDAPKPLVEVLYVIKWVSMPRIK